MKVNVIGVSIVMAMMVNVLAASAQTPSAAAARAVESQKARFQIAVMEGVLEKAVQQGARILNQRFQTISPTIMLLGVGGRPRVRGFRLDGYGVFFDVDVPAVPQSMAWSMKLLGQSGASLGGDLQVLRRHINGVSDTSTKRELEEILRRVEQQVGPISVQVPNTPAGAVSVQLSTSSPAPPLLLEDPAQAYTNEVKEALIDAMLDYSISLGLGPDEYLTIAARDNEEIPLAANDLSEAMTITLRIKGSDLAAYHSRRITKEDAKQRVEVREI